MDSAQSPPPTAKTLVILGTFSIDLDKGALSKEGADLFWEHADEEHRFLVACNDAKLAIIDTTKNKQINGDFLAQLDLQEEKVSGSDEDNKLEPGTVLAVRTNIGNLAKVTVLRYYDLHNFDFPGAEIIPEEWKTLALSNPKIANYHMAIEWTLYKPAAFV